MVDAAVPGHTKFEELNDAVSDVYVALKRKLKNTSETDEGTKHIDNKVVSKYMSAGQDRSGGVFVPEGSPKLNERCPVCYKTATEETVAKCDNPDCPYNYLRKIRGDAEPEGIKEKEEPGNGKKEGS